MNQQFNEVNNGILEHNHAATNKRLQSLLVACKDYLNMSYAFVDKNTQNEVVRLRALIEKEVE